MFDKAIFDKLKQEMEDEDTIREEVIAVSRNVIRLSKDIIYSLHRHDVSTAEKSIKEIKTLVDDSLKKYKGTKNYYTGSFKVAIQEYVEALAYYEYMVNEKILDYESLGVNAEYYLLGMCDLSGELVRMALNKGIEGDFEVMKKIHSFVSALYNEMNKFDFKNELRKKFDSIRWDLKKLEELAFELKMRDKI